MCHLFVILEHVHLKMFSLTAIKQLKEPGIEYSYVRFIFYSPVCWPNCEKIIYHVITEKRFDTIGCHSELRTLVIHIQMYIFNKYDKKTILGIYFLSINGTYLDRAVYGISNDKFSLIVLPIPLLLTQLH
ncbi:LOW QUALITY PROTEIN: hypothetical protein MXB_3107 [Myxobolus squamalis]|nr:LOW QUALITY PROTEIN: hypothetical protein MXB_3107 [Myxobolus squamalis]